MKVAYTLPDDGGCTFYRAQLPFGTCAKNGQMKTATIAGFDNPEAVVERMNTADIIMAHRVNDPRFEFLVKHYQTKGRKVVMDWDDDIFNVSPLTPAYAHSGLEEVVMEIQGKPKKIWEDGVNFSIKKNQANLDGIKKACEVVDMLTVTTERLGDVYRQFNDNVKVLPNCLDLNVWQKLPLMPRLDVRMGWFGGYSHFEDWCVIADSLAEVMSMHKNLKLVILGQIFPFTLKNIDPKRIDHRHWVHIQALPYLAPALDLDFGIIPLQDKAFNWGKSPIKWIEMAAMKVPAVTSYVSPYAEIMDLVPNNGIFIEDNDTEAWIAGISKMVEDRVSRNAMALAAYQTVADNFDITNQYHQWTNAYQELWTAQRRKISRLEVA